MKYLTSLLCLFIACYDVFSAGWSSAWPSYNVDTRELVTVSHIPSGITNPAFAKDAWSADCWNALRERVYSLNISTDSYGPSNSYYYPRFFRSERENLVKYKAATLAIIPNFVNQYYNNKSKIESWYPSNSNGWSFPGFVLWTKTGVLARANVPIDFFEHTPIFRALGEDTNYGWSALYRVLKELTTTANYDTWYTYRKTYAGGKQYNYKNMIYCYEGCQGGGYATPELFTFFPAYFEDLDGPETYDIYKPKNGYSENWEFSWCQPPYHEDPCDDIMMFSCDFSTWVSLGWIAVYASTNIAPFNNSPIISSWYKQDYIYSSNCFNGTLPSSWPIIADERFVPLGSAKASVKTTFVWNDNPMMLFYYGGWVFDKWTQAIEPFINRHPGEWGGFFSWGPVYWDCGSADNCGGIYYQEAESQGPSVATMCEWNYEYK